MKKSIYKPTEEEVEILIDTYGESVYKLAFLYLNDQKMADSIFQNVFYKAMKHFARFQQNNNEKIWLIRTTIQDCQKVIVPNLYKEIEGKSQVNGYLYPLLMQLSPKYREVIVLSYYANLTNVEIAAILKITQASIPQYLFQGEQILRKIIDVKMMKHQIKGVLEAQVKQITYSPELKVKTLNNIKTKPHNKIETFPISLKQFSIITVITLIVGIWIPSHYFSTMMGVQEPNLEEVRIPDYTPQMSQPLSETLSELGLDYQENVIIFEDQTMMNSYIIEGLSGYEIQFTSFLYQINICDEVNKVLNIHGVKERHLNVIEIGKSRVFVYKEMPSSLLEYLNVQDKVHFCL